MLKKRHTGRDRRQAAASGGFDVTGKVVDAIPDHWRDRGDVLSLAPGVRRAEVGSGEEAEEPRG